MKSDCKQVQQLLPHYVQGLCSEEERRAVEEHVRGCEECRELLNALEANEVELTDDPPAAREKVSPKKRRRNRIFALVTAVALVFAFIAVAFVYQPNLYYQYLYRGDRIFVNLHLHNLDPSFPIEDYIQINAYYVGEDQAKYSEVSSTLYALSPSSQDFPPVSDGIPLSWKRTEQGSTLTASLPGGQKGYYLLDLQVKQELYDQLSPGQDFSAYQVGGTYPIYNLEAWDIWDLNFDLTVLSQAQEFPLQMHASAICRTQEGTDLFVAT